MAEKVTERSLYPDLQAFLKELGFDSVTEIEVKLKDIMFPDIIFKSKKGEQFVLQVKVGEQKGLEGVVDAHKHAKALGTDNIIILVYPSKIRAVPGPLTGEIIKQIALETITSITFLTKEFTQKFEDKSTKDALRLFAQYLEEDRTEYNPTVAIETLRDSISSLSSLLREKAGYDVANVVVGKFELFLSIGKTSEEVNEEKLKVAAIDLTAYILVNQMVFYRIFSKVKGNITALEEIDSLDTLKTLFEKLWDINYHAIYFIDVVSALPKLLEISELVKKISAAITILKPEQMQSAILGELFHSLPPKETRKTLAAFYTRQVAAEIMATLAINREDEKVFDPACGSGTLLVAAYRRKIDLMKKGQASEWELLSAHSRFVEEQISGTDIMPFAGHLAAINLASQNLTVTTNKVRIASIDFLSTYPGITIGPSLSLTGFLPEQVKTIGPQGVGEEFALDKVDVVLMNPPFTKSERMPSDFRQHLAKDKSLTQQCGNEVGLWGRFMALSNRFLKERGRIAAIIPINFLRGRESSKIRYFFFDGANGKNNYTWRYIIKSVNDYGLTEGAEYRDIGIVLEKRQPKPNDKVGIILIKKRWKDMTSEGARALAENLRSVAPGREAESPEADIYWEDHQWLFSHKRHLMPLVSLSSLSNRKILLQFLDECTKGGGKGLDNIDSTDLLEGFRPVPEGLSQVVFITNATYESRLEKAFLILEKEDGKQIYAKIVKTHDIITIPKDKCLPSVRTTTGLSTMDISNKLDYIIVKEHPNTKHILTLSKFHKEPDWGRIENEVRSKHTNLIISHRINPYSPTTRFLAFYSDVSFYPSNVPEVYKTLDLDGAKILCLFLNSTYFFLQFFIHREETTGRLLNIRIKDLTRMKVIQPYTIPLKDKELLLNAYDILKSVEFPSLMEQFRTGFEGRVKLDMAVLNVLRMEDKEIETWLPQVYKRLYEEMAITRSLSKD